MSAVPERKGRHMPGVKLTYEDLVRLPDDGMRHELIDGEHFVTPAPDSLHQAVSLNLSGLFWNYLRAHPIGRVFAAPYDVELSRHTVIEPDLLYIDLHLVHEVTSPQAFDGLRHAHHRPVRIDLAALPENGADAGKRFFQSEGEGCDKGRRKSRHDRADADQDYQCDDRSHETAGEVADKAVLDAIRLTRMTARPKGFMADTFTVDFSAKDKSGQ